MYCSTPNALLLLLFSGTSYGFTLIPQSKSCSISATPLFAGGWGKRAKDFVDDEFVSRGSEGGERRGYDAYELQNRGDFMRRVRKDQAMMKKKNDESFLEIARMAGVGTDQNGDGIAPMGSFDSSTDDDFDDLDVSVPLDEDGDAVGVSERDFDPDTSITRLDGDNDVAGASGQW